MNALAPRRGFESLSLKDLLDARELHHWHLMHKDNVIGTAVGRYLIRKSEPWPDQSHPGVSRRMAQPKPPRRLDNSEVRPYSWPCVLVFVRRWVHITEFRGGKDGYDPEQVVPKTLYMPDGRTVPVCIVEALADEAPPPPVSDWHWPDSRSAADFPSPWTCRSARRWRASAAS